MTPESFAAEIAALGLFWELVEEAAGAYVGDNREGWWGMRVVLSVEVLNDYSMHSS